MATKTHCLVLFMLVLSHVNSNQLVVTEHEDCTENSDTACSFGVLISFETIDEKIDKLHNISLENTNYFCVDKYSSVLLLSEEKRKKEFKPLIFISMDSEEYKEIKVKIRNPRYIVDYQSKEKSCFVYGDWTTLDKKEDNKYEIYLNFLTPGTMINKNNFFVFTFSLYHDFSNFSIDITDTEADGYLSALRIKRKQISSVGCSGYDSVKSMTFYLNNHKFTKSQQGTLKMGFFFDNKVEHKEKDDNELFKDSIFKSCTPTAYKLMVLEYLQNKKRLNII